MAIAALVISLIAVLIALGSLWYTRRADLRAGRAERRDATRFAGEQAASEVAALERIGSIMRREVAQAQADAATDPQAPRRLKAAQARLEQAIDASGHDLPACSTYSGSADPALLPEAETELERALGAIRGYWRQSP